MIAAPSGSIYIYGMCLIAQGCLDKLDVSLALLKCARAVARQIRVSPRIAVR